MKKTLSLEQWQIKPHREPMAPGEVDIGKILSENTENWTEIGGAWSVQEALLQKGELSDKILEDGHSEYCNWIGNTDWVYRCTFDVAEPDRISRLHFLGVDTVAEVFLNGKYLGQCRSMYLDWTFPAEDLKRSGNGLLLYFHGRKKMLQYYEAAMLPHWKGNVRAEMMLRKGRDYGAAYGYSPIGLCGSVLLEQPDVMEFSETDLEVDFNLDYTSAILHFCASGSGRRPAGGAHMRFSICEESGKEKHEVTAEISATAEGWHAHGELELREPKLWWPKNYGEQPLYHITYTLESDTRCFDEVKKQTGLRHVRLIDDMRFEVNGVEVFWWGSGITPIHGLTNRYRHEIAMELIERFSASNMNALRIWGPGRPYPDAFYNELDARGIMVWQDFPTGTWQMPDNMEYQELYGKEAEYMVRRLKAHPCIMLWCGGNEHIYMCELDEIKTRIGFDMLHYGYREICNRLDPKRYYHVSCPFGGVYTNDTRVGDSHGSRAFGAYTPGEEYGRFFSEDIRVFPPEYKSALRFMGEHLWDDDFVDTKPFGVEYAMPAGWQEELSNNGHLKLGPVDEYYSARTPQEMIYKYAMAAAQDLYEIGAHARTGNPPWRASERRQCTGHLFWKFNDPWPRFYCSFYDYYGEYTLPYYAVNRVFSPRMVYIQVTDRIYVWAVNDTREDWSGELDLRVFDISRNKTVRERRIPAAVPAGRSVLLTTMDDFGPVRWASVLYAAIHDTCLENNKAPSAYAFVAKENMLAFPQARLTLSWCEEGLKITTDSFARCVELSGDENGNAFGWYFSDNYFDLLPFETKVVTVDTRHQTGTIAAKAHYSHNKVSIEFHP